MCQSNRNDHKRKGRGRLCSILLKPHTHTPKQKWMANRDHNKKYISVRTSGITAIDNSDNVHCQHQTENINQNVGIQNIASTHMLPMFTPSEIGYPKTQTYTQICLLFNHVLGYCICLRINTMDISSTLILVVRSDLVYRNFCR